MNKKSQVAMELLMTYGWAILVVLVAIGALAYFGVLTPVPLTQQEKLEKVCDSLSTLTTINGTTTHVPSVRLQQDIDAFSNVSSIPSQYIIVTGPSQYSDVDGLGNKLEAGWAGCLTPVAVPASSPCFYGEPGCMWFNATMRSVLNPVTVNALEK